MSCITVTSFSRTPDNGALSSPPPTPMHSLDI